jgi:outer membrane protein OmpA-like peptidoglycan-associated protein
MKGFIFLSFLFYLFLLSPPLSGQAPEAISTRTPVFLTPFPEFAPLIAPAGDVLFFSRAGHPANFGFEDRDDIWMADLNYNGQWNAPLNLGPTLNTEIEDQIFAVSLDNNRLYLRRIDQKGKPFIAIAEKDGRSWRYAQPMKIEGLDSLAVLRHAFVSINENWLFACIYHPDDGWGKTDIYVASRKGLLEWGSFKNLGPTINSEGDESTVFLAPDGNTLYFSSNGRQEGLGKQDIYMSRRGDDSWEKWTTPINLGPGINTSADEEHFSTSVAGARGIFCSQEAASNTVVFQSVIPELLRPLPVFLLEGIVKNKDSKKPISAKVHYFNIEPGTAVKKESIVPVGRDGKYKLVFPPSAAVGLYAERDSLFSTSYTFNPENLPIETEDRTSEKLKELQETDPNYLNREKEIQELQISIQDMEKKIDFLAKDLEASLKNIKDKKVQILSETAKDEDPLDYEQEISGIRKQYEIESIQESLDFHGSSTKLSTPTLEGQSDGKNTFSTNEVLGPDFKGFYKKVKGQLRQKIVVPTLSKLSKDLRGGVFQNFKDKKFNAKDLNLLNPQIAKALVELEAHPLNPAADLYLDKFVQAKYPYWEQPYVLRLNDLLQSKMEKEMSKTFRSSMELYLNKELELDYRQIERAFTISSIQSKLDIQKNIEKQLRLRIGDEVNAKKESNQDTLFVSGKSELVLDIELNALARKDPILLENIFFNANTAILDTVSVFELKRLSEFLKNNSGLGVEVNVYTHSNLTYEFASAITSERGQVIAQELIDRGIDPLRVHYRGLGKVNPLNKNDTSRARCKNQRVEIIFFDLKDN